MGIIDTDIFLMVQSENLSVVYRILTGKIMFLFVEANQNRHDIKT